MKALIMVAGVGSRLSKKVKHLPKCLLMFGAETILSRNIRLLNEQGITDVVVAAGYRANLVREEVRESARCIINPFFRVTNSLASLWFASQQLNLDNDDLLIFNGDVIYEEAVLSRLLEAPKVPTLLIDTGAIECADYRLRVEGGCVVQQGKMLSNSETSGEYVGCAKLSREYLPIYLARVRELVENRERYDMWWEEALFAIRDEFKLPIHVYDVRGLFWAEADYVEDVERIESWFKNGVNPTRERAAAAPHHNTSGA